MARRVGVREVAEAANVSLGTVSNVLNRPDLVAAGTRDRVLAVIDQLGFVRNESARQLRTGSSKTVGVIVLDVGNPFFTDVARGVEDRINESGLITLLCSSGEDADKELRCLHLLEQPRVRGILITPVGDPDETGRAYCHAERQWFSWTGALQLAGSVPCRSTTKRAVQLAMEHLISQGHHEIAFIGGPSGLDRLPTALPGREPRWPRTTFRRPTSSSSRLSDHDVTEGKRAGAKLAEMPARSRPTAVFCANDLLALGVLQVMTREGLRVPDDIAIIGFDDIDFAAAAAVPLSSIRQPSEDLGKTAAGLLLDEVSNPGTHRHRQVIFAPELVVRDSTARVRREHAQTRRSMAG